MAARDDGSGPVDWALAASVAGRLAPPGPTGAPEELAALVSGLRAAAARAADEVVAVTGLRPAGAWPTPVLVVDRAGWATGNAQSLAAVTAPLATAAGPVSRATRASAGLQVGGVLALMSGRVLGQFDPFGTSPGRLMLVAPNVLEVGRRLEVDPGDFRLWVALHEQTHALQFAVAPWLAAHLRGRMESLLAGMGPDRVFGTGDLGTVVGAVARALAGREGGGLLGLLEPKQRVVFDEVGAVMSLLEGHADVTMDQVGPGVVPSVATIRGRFDARRQSAATATGPAALARRLLGMDLKLAQYREGAAFVRAVRARAGDGFDAVWTSPETLPTPAEIADPSAWVARVRP
ncbi:MAG TPA: zinc-dependent metalloprotease [Cellulomonas sp.]